MANFKLRKGVCLNESLQKNVYLHIGSSVKNVKEGVIANFRIGRDTVYTPHRYPYVGEKVKVEYCLIRGVDVAYTVTILGGPK